MMADVPLSRESFRRLHPIGVPRPVSQVPDRVWTEEEWDRIRRGARAGSMDEKWNVFAEGDVLFMHRSWTGHGVYEVSFTRAAGPGRRIASAVVEGDAQRYRNMGDVYDCLILELIIGAVVLGERAVELRAGLVELTARASGRSDLPSGAVEHSVLGLRCGS